MKKTFFNTRTGIITLCASLLGGSIALAGCGASAGSDATATTTAAAVTAASDSTAASTSSASAKAASDAVEKNVTLQVTDKDGKVSEYKEDTEAEVLRDVLDEISEDSDFSYEGQDSGYGLMIDHVNGERADYTLDGAYWAIYVNGEYGNYGIDSQPVVDGDTFELRYEAAK